MKSNSQTGLFTENVLRYWASIDAGDKSATNKISRANDRLVKSLQDEGELASALAPLLGDERNSVRQVAAAYLLTNNCMRDEAIAELRRLCAADTTLVGIMAGAALRICGVAEEADN